MKTQNRVKGRVSRQPARWADEIVKNVGKHWIRKTKTEKNSVQKRRTSSIG